MRSSDDGLLTVKVPFHVLLDDVSISVERRGLHLVKRSFELVSGNGFNLGTTADGGTCLLTGQVRWSKVWGAWSIRRITERKRASGSAAGASGIGGISGGAGGAASGSISGSAAGGSGMGGISGGAGGAASGSMSGSAAGLPRRHRWHLGGQAVQPAGPSTGRLQVPRASEASREVSGGAGGAASGSISGSAAGASGIGGMGGISGGGRRCSQRVHQRVRPQVLRAWAASREAQVAHPVVQPAGPSAGRAAGASGMGGMGGISGGAGGAHQASEAWAAFPEVLEERRASAAWAAFPEELEALRQASEAWAASRRRWRRCVGHRGHGRHTGWCRWGIAGRHGRHGRHTGWSRWGFTPGGMGGMGGRPGGMGGFSSLIVYSSASLGATDCWTHDEHITILQG